MAKKAPSKRKEKGKRYNVTIPYGVGLDLDQWAKAEGNNPTALAGFLLEQSVRSAKEKGCIPVMGDYVLPLDCKSLVHLLHRYWGRLIEYGRIPINRLQELKDGAIPNELEIARIALCLEVSERSIEDVVERGKSEVSNGNS